MPQHEISVAELIDQAQKAFRSARLSYGHGVRTARDEAVWLVCSVLKIDFLELENHFSRTCRPSEISRVRRTIRRRIDTRAPLAYILKESWLGGYRFIIDKRAIVPRSFLADVISNHAYPWLRRPSAAKRILDLCTGSGCLAILAAHAFPNARVDAVDLSKSALNLAAKNVRLHKLGSRISLIHSNLFEEIHGRKYDLILSNPPYVTDKNMQYLPGEYAHEPRLALSGGSDGLKLVSTIVQQYSDFLTKNGTLILELGRNKTTFERRFPTLSPIWLSTRDQEDQVLALGKI